MKIYFLTADTSFFAKSSRFASKIEQGFVGHCFLGLSNSNKDSGHVKTLTPPENS